MFIGQDVFRTIVEMSCEMEFIHKVREEIKNCVLLLPEFIEATPNNRNGSTRLRKLRTTRDTKPEPVRYSLPWKCFEKEFCHRLEHVYERYRNAEDNVRERGVLQLTIVKKSTYGGFYPTRFTTVLTYRTDEEFTTAKQELHDIYRGGLGYYMWGSVNDRKPKYLK